MFKKELDVVGEIFTSFDALTYAYLSMDLWGEYLNYDDTDGIRSGLVKS